MVSRDQVRMSVSVDIRGCKAETPHARDAAVEGVLLAVDHVSREEALVRLGRDLEDHQRALDGPPVSQGAVVWVARRSLSKQQLLHAVSVDVCSIKPLLELLHLKLVKDGSRLHADKLVKIKALVAIVIKLCKTA